GLLLLTRLDSISLDPNVPILLDHYNQTKKVIRAFQYHFRPKKYDGTMDNETYSILKLLNNKYENN
ncbi:hypothetical protein NK213_20375, partial [Sebaldella sp. S0638]|nr:hypothetical protein [Sebaldella sp. S0638]